jgi:hypothetical protein
MKNTENTGNMFQLITCENHVVGQALGLSYRVADSVACHAFENTDDLDERVHDVLSCSENWEMIVERVIEDIESVIDDNDSENNGRWKWEGDLKILNDMKRWTFDAAEMESMVRESCQEEQE